MTSKTLRCLLDCCLSVIADLKPWKPDDEQTRLLNSLCQTRRSLVDQRTSLGQQLLDLLKCYFPALFLLANCKLYTCPLLLKLLAKWPDPREFKRQHPATLEAIFEQFGYKKPEQRDPLIKSIKDAPLCLASDGNGKTPRMD